jgi:hypothetical protein
MTSKKEQQIQLSLLKDQQNQIEKLSKSSSLEAIKAAESKLFQDALEVIQPYMRFAELGFDDETGEVDSIPFEWEGLPEEEKKKKIRLAKAGWMPSSDTPHGVKMAHATVLGIIKAKSQEASGTKVLNIESITFPSPSQKPEEFEVIDVDGES